MIHYNSNQDYHYHHHHKFSDYRSNNRKMVFFTAKSATNMSSFRNLLQIFIFVIFAITFILADTTPVTATQNRGNQLQLLKRFISRNANNNNNNSNNNKNHNRIRKYFTENNEKTRAAIEELNEVLRNLFPVVPNHNGHHHGYIISSRHHGTIWVKPPLSPTHNNGKDGRHSSSIPSWISNFDDTNDNSLNFNQRRPSIQIAHPDEFFENGDEQDQDSFDNVDNNLSTVSDSLDSLRPQQQKPMVQAIMKHQNKNIFNDENGLSLEENSRETFDSRKIFRETDEPTWDSVTSTPPPSSTTSSLIQKQQQQKQLFKDKDSINRIRNHINLLLQQQKQIQQQLKQQQQQKQEQKQPKTNNKPRPPEELESLQLSSAPSSSSSTSSTSNSLFPPPPLGKRGPECMRRCILQGLLHPVQCHSLC